MRNLSAQWVPECLKADQKRQRHQPSEQILEFLGAIQMISCRNWWPWKKPGHITVTRRQRNNKWSGGMASHSTPKYSECKNSLENFAPRFFVLKTASSTLMIFQRAKLSTRSITHLCWCNCRTFWKKNAGGSSPSGSCTTIPGLTGHLQPRSNWPPWTSNILITHPILRIWHRQAATCSRDWKNNRIFAIFLPRRRSLLPRITGWTDNILIFLTGLQKIQQRAEKCIELRGKCVE